MYEGVLSLLFIANLAQMAEHFIRNERVVGSIPIVGSAYGLVTSDYLFITEISFSLMK